MVTVQVLIYPVRDGSFGTTVEIGNVGFDVDNGRAVQSVHTLYDDLACIGGERQQFDYRHSNRIGPDRHSCGEQLNVRWLVMVLRQLRHRRLPRQGNMPMRGRVDFPAAWWL